MRIIVVIYKAHPSVITSLVAVVPLSIFIFRSFKLLQPNSFWSNWKEHKLAHGIMAITQRDN